jgi:SSS family solute:Na+ symporter
VLGGLIAGIAVGTLFVIDPTLRPVPIHAGIYGLAANVLTLAVVSLARPAKPDPHDEDFLRTASGSTD